MNKVVIVIPIYKELLNPYEEISLLQCKKIFANYPIRLLNPHQLGLDYYYKLFEGHFDFGNISFPKKFFRSPQTYNRFMKSIGLFRALTAYDYLLMYHTDSFAFRNELDYWINKGYDYIGAPLYEFDGTISPPQENFICIGNGGFSLLNIKAALKILTTFRRVYKTRHVLQWYNKYNLKGKLFYFPYLTRMILGLGGNSHYLLNYNLINEDVFWGKFVPEAFKEFRVATFEESYRFSMEYNCEKLFILNNSRLPFGCHQWYKGEFLNFWKDKIDNIYNVHQP